MPRSEVLLFFCEHPRPPTLRAFMAQARENTLGWANELRPLAPFNNDISKAVDRCFNAYGARKVERWELKTYANLFADFHRRPEYKYAKAEDRERGATERRSVAPSRIDIIGKETIRYSREDHIGGFEPAQFSSTGSVEFLRAVVRRYRTGALARACSKSNDTIRRILNEEQNFSPNLSTRVRQFDEEEQQQEQNKQREQRQQEDEILLERAKLTVKREGLRHLARRLATHAGHLSEMIHGKREITKTVRQKLVSL